MLSANANNSKNDQKIFNNVAADYHRNTSQHHGLK